jgi:hypothetical protein
VGHDSTAALMGELLGKTIPVSRIQVTPEAGDRLLCFKLKGRAPEGVILCKEEIEKIGYEWVLMLYHGTVGRAVDAKFEELECLRKWFGIEDDLVLISSFSRLPPSC